MLEAGLVEETKRLLEAGMSRSARQALGYRQVVEAFASDDLSGLRDAIVRATRRFARRQEAWFRSDPRVVWFDASASDVVDAVCGALAGAAGVA